MKSNDLRNEILDEFINSDFKGSDKELAIKIRNERPEILKIIPLLESLRTAICKRRSSTKKQKINDVSGKNNSTEWSKKNGVISVKHTDYGEPIKTEEQAIERFEIDTEKYSMVDFSWRSWTTPMKIDNEPVIVINYYCSFKLELKAVEISLKNFKFKKRIIPRKKGKGNLVLPLADFHIGADIRNLMRTKDFNIDILCGYLETIAEGVNKKGYNSVHLMLLGDFIESFTGLNHINSWKGLAKDSYGMNASILAHEVLSKHLYTKINNLKSVDFVSGNHDRVSSDNKLDTKGEVGYLISYLFKKEFTIESTFTYSVGTRIVDDICYVFTHGHLGLSKKETGKIIHDYGIDGCKYYVLLEGHLHSRKTFKYYKTKIEDYDNVQLVQHDSLDYRRITLPSLFTGNWYSESNGWTSSAGWTELFVDSDGIFIHLDKTII